MGTMTILSEFRRRPSVVGEHPPSLRLVHLVYYSMISFLMFTSFGGESLLPFAFLLDVTFMVLLLWLPLTPTPPVLPLPIPLSLWMELLLPVLMRPDTLLLLAVPLPPNEVDADAVAFVIDNGIVIYCWPLSGNVVCEKGEPITLHDKMEGEKNRSREKHERSASHVHSMKFVRAQFPISCGWIKFLHFHSFMSTKRVTTCTHIHITHCQPASQPAGASTSTSISNNNNNGCAASIVRIKKFSISLTVISFYVSRVLMRARVRLCRKPHASENVGKSTH